MPRETVYADGGEPFEVRVGWSPDRDMQVGVVCHEDRSMFWQLLGHDQEHLAEVGAMVRAVVAEGAAVELGETGRPPLPDEEVGRVLLNELDVRFRHYSGLWCNLDRQGANRLIKLVRRARDAAFGRDE